MFLPKPKYLLRTLLLLVFMAAGLLPAHAQSRPVRSLPTVKATPSPQMTPRPSATPTSQPTQKPKEEVGFMGMPMDTKPAPKSTDESGDEAQSLAQPAFFWEKYMGEKSPYRPIILPVLTLIVLFMLKRYLSRVMRKSVVEKAFDPENAHAFMKVWNGIWKFVIAVLVLIAMSGSFRVLGLTTGFLGMMLGWSLQQPVTGIAAWLMIIFKKPFKVGDRVVIAGTVGDVTKITLTHVILNQVGGSVSGEERSGRGILIPNAILFQHIIINYTLDQEYMLDEVPVRLTFASDWEKAKEIMLAVANKCTKDIIEQTGSEPFIRAEFLDWGILVRLRYQTIPAKRQEISTNIIEGLLHEFKREYPRIRFASPTTIVRYRPDEAEGESPS